jgi:cytochrome c553
MRHRRLFGMFAAGLWWAGSVGAADPDAGREKAQQCATCHGPKGMATMPMTPHLAGQPEGYLSEQLKAYRSGKRQHEIMSLMAKPLSDDDIANLAAWYGSLRVEVIDKP